MAIALPCQGTDRARWFNPVDECCKCKHATIRQHWQRSDPMAYRHRQIDCALIQWHTGIVRLTALWSNGIQAWSDWLRSDPMAYRHHQIDSALIQWHTDIVRLTALWSNGIQASSDWLRSDPMAYRHGQIDCALIQWHTGIIRLTALWSNGIQTLSDWQRSDPMAYRRRQIDSGAAVIWATLPHLSQPCYNVVPVPALIGAPSAGGAVGHRLARLCLETVLFVNTKAHSVWMAPREHHTWAVNLVQRHASLFSLYWYCQSV